MSSRNIKIETYDGEQFLLTATQLQDTDFAEYWAVDKKPRYAKKSDLKKFFKVPATNAFDERYIDVRQEGSIVPYLIFIENGRLSIGCKTFDEKTTLRIKRWANRTAQRATAATKIPTTKRKAA